MHIVSTDAIGKRGVALAIETREGGLIGAIRLEAAVRNPQRSASMLDLILHEMCQKKPDFAIDLHGELVVVEQLSKRFTHAIVER